MEFPSAGIRRRRRDRCRPQVNAWGLDSDQGAGDARDENAHGHAHRGYAHEPIFRRKTTTGAGAV